VIAPVTAPARRGLCALLAAGALGSLAGCDAIEDQARDQVTTTGGSTERREAAPPVEPAACPPDLANCSSASGTVIYVESVDPDGDGDAHFVLESEEGITAKGVSVIDVRRDLRPNPLPGPGDRVSAAGPVYRGSYGQRQIEAVVVHATYTPSR
jgi:hypothetical protein